jgi:hypothetical protein
MNCDVDVGKARLGRTRGGNWEEGQARFSWVLGQRLTMTFEALGIAGIRKRVVSQRDIDRSQNGDYINKWNYYLVDVDNICLSVER